jgi:peptidoglycan/LPS O-acetylase OafA/YrhL
MHIAATARRPRSSSERMTLGAKLQSRAHKENGFDTIRLIAAALVLVSHSYPIATGSNANEPLMLLTRGQSTLGDLSVGIFFFISGLLISNSFDASRTLGSFVRKRVLRIMPALVVVCLLIVCVLGPLFTILPLQTYFAGAWRFMANAVFLPTAPNLPGVFQGHPMTAVNGSLWSLKFEVACYAGTALLLAFASGRTALAVGLWIASFIVSGALNGGRDEPGLLYYVGTMANLYRYFGMGVVCFVFRDRVVLRKDWAWIAAALSVAAVLTPLFLDAAAIFGCYALLVFAYECPAWFRKVTAKRDISYGTYVYAFPIQQMSLGVVGSSPWLLTAMAMPLTFLAALASWLLVEKPALKRKKASPPGAPRTVPINAEARADAAQW